MTPPLRLGTRGSRLALWQARWVRDLLGAVEGAPPVELIRVETAGDRIRDRPLSQAGGRDFFTREIETALLEGRIDLAVHSFKDLATDRPDGLRIGAVPTREDPTDALVSLTGARLHELPAGARVGTSSLRRTAFLNRLRPELQVAALRGNVPTRLEKLDAGDYGAVILASAGLRRLGLGERITERLAPRDFTPAPAQGAVAIEIRADDPGTARWVSALDDPVARRETDAERALLATLEGGCSVPIGALAREREGELRLQARVTSVDGTADLFGELRDAATTDPSELGRRLARELLDRGADRILDELRRATSS